MKSALLLLSGVLLVFISRAQSTEDSIKATINALFDGMKAADAKKIRGAFADSALLQTIQTSKEGTKVRNEPLAAFVASVSKLAKGDADERVEFELIKIDGPLATVWTPYKFYYKGNFSHCGVDSYQMVRLNGEWKIQYLIDTRRKTGCE
jgi:hypothetical protein